MINKEIIHEIYSQDITLQDKMETIINDNSEVPQGMENINPTINSSYENIYQYGLSDIFENSSRLTAIAVDCQMDSQNQNGNLQHSHNETVPLMLQNLNSQNNTYLPLNSFQPEDKNREKEELRLLLRSWNQEELVEHLLSK